MVMTVFADTTPLLEAIAAADERRVTAETLRLLGPENVLPSSIAGRVGLPALWGGCDPHALSLYAVVGRVGEWIRAIPIGPEPDADARRRLTPALPLVQGFLAIAGAVRRGLPEPHPALPEPLLPGDIKNPDGALGELRDAFARRDLTQVRRVLHGYYATGTDYRAFLGALFATLEFRSPEGGHPTLFAHAGARVLDMAGWGGHVPPFISWYPPLMLDDAPDAPPAQAARAFAAAQEHDLGWLRTRLAIPKEEAAGAPYQQALLAGDATAACAATLAALRAGATPAGVTAGMALAVAGRINAAPEGDRDSLLRAGHALLYVHAIHDLMTRVQDPVIWPMLYTAASVANSARAAGTGAALESTAAVSRSLLGGGLIAPTMLRAFEQQLGAGDTSTALATARRYVQMGHPSRALAGILGTVAALRDTTNGGADTSHTLPLVAAAAQEYLTLPEALRQGGQNALLTAAIRLASELRGAHDVADRVRAAIADYAQGAP